MTLALYSTQATDDFIIFTALSIFVSPFMALFFLKAQKYLLTSFCGSIQPVRGRPSNAGGTLATGIFNDQAEPLYILPNGW